MITQLSLDDIPRFSAQIQRKVDPEEAHFDGSDYVAKRDFKRLSGQLKKIYDLMIDGKFRTLGEIELLTNAPQASISAQLRNLKKKDFGSHTLNKKHLGNGLYSYQLMI